MELRQESTFTKYRQQFIARGTPLSEVSKVCFLIKFINGMKLEIQKELRLLRPMGLGQAIDLSQMKEDKLNQSPLKARALGYLGG